MSMIIESLSACERRVSLVELRLGGCARRTPALRRSALACRTGWLIPAERPGSFARHRVQRARRIAGTLKCFERLAAHRGVDVQIRHASNGAKRSEERRVGK